MTTKRITVIPTSRVRTSPVTHQGTSARSDSATKTMPSRVLSAMGSAIFAEVGHLPATAREVAVDLVRDRRDDEGEQREPSRRRVATVVGQEQETDDGDEEDAANGEGVGEIPHGRIWTRRRPDRQAGSSGRRRQLSSPGSRNGRSGGSPSSPRIRQVARPLIHEVSR
jgi:hypothetical protein